MKEFDTELMSIGEFARRTRLSPRALGLYDDTGPLLPASVDGAPGYRSYAVALFAFGRVKSTRAATDRSSGVVPSWTRGRNVG